MDLDIVSGHFQYNLGLLKKFNRKSEQHRNLYEFLDGNDSNAAATKSCQEISKIKSLLHKSYVLNCLHVENQFKDVENILGYRDNENSMIFADLKTEVRDVYVSVNSKLMTLVLNYIQICQKEVNKSRLILEKEKLAIEKSKRRAVEIKNFKLFSKCLDFESNRKIGLSFLTTDNPQYIRCVKAFQDNLHPNLKGNVSFDFQVLNVIKVNNEHLNSELHTSLSSVSDGKVKGLFCFLPKSMVHKFCTYGLYTQNLDNLANISEGLCSPLNKNGSSKAGSSSLDYNVEELSNLNLNSDRPLQPISPSHQGNSTSFNQQFQFSTKANTKHTNDWIQPPWYSMSRSTSSTSSAPSRKSNSSKNACNTAKYASNVFSESDPFYYKFSKYCTCNNLEKLTERLHSQVISDSDNLSSADDGDDTVFIALCRVLITKMKGVSSPHWSDKVIKEAIKQNVNVLYNSASEEYIYLNPHLVLPEFVIQVRVFDHVKAKAQTQQQAQPEIPQSIAKLLNVDKSFFSHDKPPTKEINTALPIAKGGPPSPKLSTIENSGNISRLHALTKRFYTLISATPYGSITEEFTKNSRNSALNPNSLSSILLDNYMLSFATESDLNAEERNERNLNYEETKTNSIEKKTLVLAIEDLFYAHPRMLQEKVKDSLRNLSGN